ncbi:MAG: hypothetical protein H6543_05255 [Prevotellaceae bacterium]|nr:hypothetical protein [Prevotellaceae bacterium]
MCGSLSVVAQDAKAVMEEAIKGSQQAVELVKVQQKKWKVSGVMGLTLRLRYVELGCWW